MGTAVIPSLPSQTKKKALPWPPQFNQCAFPLSSPQKCLLASVACFYKPTAACLQNSPVAWRTNISVRTISSRSPLCSFPAFKMLILSSGGPVHRMWPNYQLLISKSFFYFPQTLFPAPKSSRPLLTAICILGANPPRALSEVQPLASPAPAAGIQETLPSERAESSVGGGGKRGHGGIPQPDHGSSRDPGRATASGAPPQTIAVPAGQRSARSHTSAARLPTQGRPGPAPAHLTLPQLRALARSPARRDSGPHRGGRRIS